MVLLQSGVIELFEIVHDTADSGETPTYRTKVLAEFEFDQIEYVQEGQVDKSLVKVAIKKLNVRSPEQANGPYPSIIATRTKKLTAAQPYPILVRYEYGFKENEIRQQLNKKDSTFLSSRTTPPFFCSPEWTPTIFLSFTFYNMFVESIQLIPVNCDIRTQGFQVTWIYQTLAKVQIFFTEDDVPTEFDESKIKKFLSEHKFEDYGNLGRFFV